MAVSDDRWSVSEMSGRTAIQSDGHFIPFLPAWTDDTGASRASAKSAGSSESFIIVQMQSYFWKCVKRFGKQESWELGRRLSHYYYVLDRVVV